jgi:hypothetical protein
MDKRTEQQLTKNIEALTDGGKLALVLCANSFRFGGNWGFLKSDKSDFRGQLDTLKQEKPNIRAIPVSNGALILANENFLAHNVNLAVPNAINGSFVDMANKRRNDERQRFSKFIENVANGKSSHVKSKGGYYELILGVFCVNETNAIRLNGNDYPAYKLNMIEALEYANQLTATGKKVYARAIKEDGEQVFDLVANLATNSKGVAALYRGLDIADSETGLFLTLRIV